MTWKVVVAGTMAARVADGDRKKTPKMMNCSNRRGGCERVRGARWGTSLRDTREVEVEVE